MHALLLCGGAYAATLSIVVDATELPPGTAVTVRLFDGPEGFSNNPTDTTRVQVATGDAGTATAVFVDVQPGTYAAMAFADLDGDGTLAQNWIGIPREPTGVSLRQGVRLFGPPSFGQSQFVVTDADLARPITLWVP